MDSFLTVVSRLKGRQSLSCNDLTTIESDYDDFDRFKQLRKSSKTGTCPCNRFLRTICAESSAQSLDRSKSRSSELVNSLDRQLAEIREKLAMLQEQDTDFHERIDSLSNSIGELASRSSLNSFGSELSEASGAASDGMLSDEDEDSEEENYIDDDQIIKHKIESISAMSFSTELLNSIPTIEVTPDTYRRRRSSKRSSQLRRSDPYVHESAKLLNSSTESNRHSICLTDHAYLYGSGEEISTLL